MALNSQFGASVFSAKNENTLAFASANIDFALIKVEVPKQFEGLGSALSAHRRENAECGPQHRTARRLGTLFEQIIPNIDILASKYGERVSEIATLSKFDLKGKEYGPFSNHAGIDGISIYAAASSGANVIALHLLACMLAASGLKPVESTALWVQLVECRLREVEQKADPNQLQGMAAFFAVQQGRQITRDDLAAWDASARAWLEVANQAKRREDTQLKLITKNVPSIHSTGDTYSDILESWTLAMTTLQKSLDGIPQDVSNGAVFLGIRAWHIYPDLQVFSPIRFVEFKDPLVKAGGVITLGLQRKGHEKTGVSWSVSLSHLRYYGDPVVIETSSGEDGDRLTAEELQLVAFGSLLGTWPHPETVNIMEAAECFVALGDCLCLESYNITSFSSDLGWLLPLVNAARRFVLSADEERMNTTYLIEFGRRRGRNFLDKDYQDALPMFGLLNSHQLFKISEETVTDKLDVEGSIALLRRLAEACDFHHDDCLIISRPVCKAGNPAEPLLLDGHWEFASAVPVPLLTGKRSQDGTPVETKRHVRWVHVNRTQNPSEQRYFDGSERDGQPKVEGWGLDLGGDDSLFFCRCRQKAERAETQPLFDDSAQFNHCECRAQGHKCTSMCDCISGFTGIEEDFWCKNVRACRMESDQADEDCFWLSLRSTFDIDTWQAAQERSFRWLDPPDAFFSRYSSAYDNSDKAGQDSTTFDSDYDWESAFVQFPDDQRNVPSSKVTGSRDPYRLNSVGRSITYRCVEVKSRAGLYLSDRARITVPSLDLATLTNALRSGKINRGLLVQYLTRMAWKTSSRPSYCLGQQFQAGPILFRSLKAMAAISELYRDWPEATILISITKRPLGLAHWTLHLSQEAPGNFGGNFESQPEVNQLHRSTKFACLVMLESGGHDFYPDQLKLVMALATGNSIYTAEALLHDPYEEDKSNQPQFVGICRVLGNVGQPGIVLIIPPPSPLMLQLDPSKGRMINAAAFDGRLQDSFEDTSLHLRFTDLKIPLAAAQGAIDADVVLREAIISVFDKSRWIADVDVLKSLASSLLIRPRGCECQDRTCASPDLGHQLVSSLGTQLKSVFKWEELLMCKDNLLASEIGVVCTHDNWSARLAAAILAVSVGCPTIVLPPQSACSQCSKRLVSTGPWVTNHEMETSKCPKILVT